MTAPPAPPYIPAKYKGGRQDVLKRIVLHSTVSGTYVGAAEAIARYFQNPTYVSSAHYVVDPQQVRQCVYDHTIAWHDGTNTNSIGVEMCDNPADGGGRWSRSLHRQMLATTADLVRQLCLAYGIPMRKLTPAQIRAGEKGICGHADMRDAFPGSTSHWDPGEFPWGEFIGLVNRGGGGGGAAPSAPAALDRNKRIIQISGGTQMRTMPKGGGQDPNNVRWETFAMSVLYEHDIIFAPTSHALILRQINTWKQQPESNATTDAMRPGGVGDLLKGKEWHVQKLACKSFRVPQGVGKVDVAYWCDGPVEVTIEPVL